MSIEKPLESAFADLRLNVQKEVYKRLTHRREYGPAPTMDEVIAGDFKEGFEPQCVDSVFLIRAKGYNTVASGFNPPEPIKQYLIMFNVLDLDTISNLESAGFIIGTDNAKGATIIEFECQEPDLDKIKHKWEELAQLLPNLHKMAPMSQIPYAKDFRNTYRGKTFKTPEE